MKFKQNKLFIFMITNVWLLAPLVIILIILKDYVRNVVLIVKNVLIFMIANSVYHYLNTKLIQTNKDHVSKNVVHICILIANNIVNNVVKIVKNVLIWIIAQNVSQVKLYLVKTKFIIISNTTLNFMWKINYFLFHSNTKFTLIIYMI